MTSSNREKRAASNRSSGSGSARRASGLFLNLVYAAVGLLLTGFVFLGAYFATRGRGLGNAHGIAAGSFAAGLVFLVLVTAQLLVGVIG